MADFCRDTLELLYGPRGADNRSFTGPTYTNKILNASVLHNDLSRTSSSMTSAAQLNLTDEQSQNFNNDPTLDVIKFYLANVVQPIFCVFGLIGNIFNVLVLSRRRMQSTMDCTMEQGAHTGLVALAVSDELYCLWGLLVSLFSRSHSVVFTHRSVGLYTRIYGKYLENTLARTGTWLTVLMAAGRYAAICRPIQARYLLSVNCTRVAVAVTFLFWTVVHLPMIWTYDVVEWSCPPDDVIILLDQGWFVSEYEGMLKISFTYVWAMLGFFIPVLLLVFFNFHLVAALRESSRMRRLYRVSARVTTTGSRVTPTLVAIVCVLLVLVTPAEFLQFYYYGVKQDRVEIFNMAIVVTNVMHTVNFSINFVMYCIVNVHFRETWTELMHCAIYRVPLTRQYSSRSSPPLTRQHKGSIKTPSTLETVI